MYVCLQCQETLNCYCQRYSNNSKPQFSDQEILSIILFIGREHRYTQIKRIHSFAKVFLLDWFTGLVSYQSFVYCLNGMVGAVGELLKHLIVSYNPEDCDEDALIVDSMLIITCCAHNHQGKVAREIVDKVYCSTKNQYYYCLKLQLVTSIAEKQLDKVAGNSYSVAVSSVREKPLKPSWELINTTNIQRVKSAGQRFDYNKYA